MRGLLSMILALSLFGCSATTTTQGDPAGTFALSADQADAVILAAIRSGWPDKSVQPLGVGRIGYRFRVWWGIDHDDVSAEAIPEPDGHYAFRVDNVGTAPASGSPARERLIGLILAEARRVAR